jgi:hypothetical protein
MLEHYNELEPIESKEYKKPTSRQEAERLLNEFKALGLSHIVSTACAVKVCENVLNSTVHNYFTQEHWKQVKKDLLYNPIGNTELIF